MLPRNGWCDVSGGPPFRANLLESDMDQWAVRVVVNEGQYMALGVAERVIAAHVMRRRGHGHREIAERLRVSQRVVTRYLRLTIPSELGWVDECL